MCCHSPGSDTRCGLCIPFPLWFSRSSHRRWGTPHLGLLCALPSLGDGCSLRYREVLGIFHIVQFIFDTPSCYPTAVLGVFPCVILYCCVHSLLCLSRLSGHRLLLHCLLLPFPLHTFSPFPLPTACHFSFFGSNSCMVNCLHDPAIPMAVAAEVVQITHCSCTLLLCQSSRWLSSSCLDTPLSCLRSFLAMQPFTMLLVHVPIYIYIYIYIYHGPVKVRTADS